MEFLVVWWAGSVVCLPWPELTGCLILLPVAARCWEPEEPRILSQARLLRAGVRREAGGVVCILTSLKLLSPSPSLPAYLWLPANLRAETGGQGTRARPSASGGCHPSRLQAWPLSLETVVLLDSTGKDDVNMKGCSGKIMATVECPLWAINLKIISKWALPILGYTRHRQFQGLMGGRKGESTRWGVSSGSNHPPDTLHTSITHSCSRWASPWPAWTWQRRASPPGAEGLMMFLIWSPHKFHPVFSGRRELCWLPITQRRALFSSECVVYAHAFILCKPQGKTQSRAEVPSSPWVFGKCLITGSNSSGFRFPMSEMSLQWLHIPRAIFSC